MVGNPNTGKSTLFNALTGFRQRVGNYPGVTVDRKIGTVRESSGAYKLNVIDLPGCYTLTARSADEAVVLDELLGADHAHGRPDVIVAVVDACNLRRNLFLTSQLIELGIPVIVALNMYDLAESAGYVIDIPLLSELLGVPVVPVVATKHRGVDDLKKSIADSLCTWVKGHGPDLPGSVAAELDDLRVATECLANGTSDKTHAVELLQALLDPGGFHEKRLVARLGDEWAQDLRRRRERIEANGESVSELEARIRYAWIDDIVANTVERTAPRRRSKTEIADRLLTHRVGGLLVFFCLMGLCFQAIYTWAAPIMDAVDGTFASLGQLVARWLPQGALQSLIQDGVIAGVGAILIFLPQILILFLFLAILEDCGYMARSAFLLDRWMSRIGLNGKAFIPLVSSFACAVPGILATRTIEDRRSRLVTILIAPLMSCSARLPVYTLMIAAFVPDKPLLGGFLGWQAVTLLAMYSIGVVVAIVIALVLRGFFLKGEASPFIMEFPSYKWPTVGTVLHRMLSQGKEFCVTAGTIIFAVSIVIWALAYYPRPASVALEHDALRVEAQKLLAPGVELDERLTEIGRDEAGSYLRQSMLGRMGTLIEPAVKPLGWDWRIGTAAIASFPAREILIATMGTIYNLGDKEDESSSLLRDKLRAAHWPDGRPVFNMAVALSIMVFFALCCQCGATLATIRRETQSWKWPLFAFVYMTSLAYVGALVTYQVASRLI